jgi:hypothetical protein
MTAEGTVGETTCLMMFFFLMRMLTEVSNHGKKSCVCKGVFSLTGGMWSHFAILQNVPRHLLDFRIVLSCWAEKKRA